MACAGAGCLRVVRWWTPASLGKERMSTLALSCVSTVPPDEAARRGLTIEIGDVLDSRRLSPAVAALTTSAHAPFEFPEGAPRTGRLNIAAIDVEWRRLSLQCLEHYIAQAARLPRVRKVVMHAAPRFWTTDGRLPQSPAKPELLTVGEYASLVDSIRHLAAVAARANLEIVVENNRAYWETVAPDEPFARTARATVPDYFATSPWEWLGLWHDVRRDNVKLCLDTGHAATAAHRFDGAQRQAMLWAFLGQPEAIGHVHWNDSTLADSRGRNDVHWALGSAGLGDEFHRAIRNLPSATFLLEHWFDLATLDRERSYIAGL